MKKKCTKCGKEGRWVYELCGKCKYREDRKEMFKSPYKEFGTAKGIVGARGGEIT